MHGASFNLMDIHNALPLLWHFSLVISSSKMNDQLLPVLRLIVSLVRQLGSQPVQQL